MDNVRARFLEVHKSKGKGSTVKVAKMLNATKLLWLEQEAIGSQAPPLHIDAQYEGSENYLQFTFSVF